MLAKKEYFSGGLVPAGGAKRCVEWRGAASAAPARRVSGDLPSRRHREKDDRQVLKLETYFSAILILLPVLGAGRTAIRRLTNVLLARFLRLAYLILINMVCDGCDWRGVRIASARPGAPEQQSDSAQVGLGRSCGVVVTLERKRRTSGRCLLFCLQLADSPPPLPACASIPYLFFFCNPKAPAYITSLTHLSATTTSPPFQFWRGAAAGRRRPTRASLSSSSTSLRRPLTSSSLLLHGHQTFLASGAAAVALALIACGHAANRTLLLRPRALRALVLSPPFCYSYGDCTIMHSH